jgi:hypothetical protein
MGAGQKSSTEFPEGDKSPPAQGCEATLEMAKRKSPTLKGLEQEKDATLSGLIWVSLYPGSLRNPGLEDVATLWRSFFAPGKKSFAGVLSDFCRARAPTLSAFLFVEI